MSKEKIKEIIQSNYDINILDIEKVKNAYKVETKDMAYCVKIVHYKYEHFNFILSAMKHLQNNGFDKIPLILKNNSGSEFININNEFAYLTEWVPSRVSNYDNPLELSKIASKLGELHKCSKGFKVTRDMKPRVGWGNWIKVFSTRCDEILDFKNRISQKAYKSEFDYIYLNAIESELKSGYRAIEEIKSSNYYDLMMKEITGCGFCHHDYAHHNVLIDAENNINIIDFDYCMLDSHLHDLSSLLIRAMKYDKWESNKADLIIDNYKKEFNVENEERNLMKGFIRFPQSFWQIGLQYYWEQQPWGDEFFINKINKYLEDKVERELFINDYFK